LAINGAITNGYSHQFNHVYIGGLATQALSKFKQVFPGHYQTLASKSNGCFITYIGSPWQWNWNDVDDVNRGFVHFNSIQSNFELVRNPFVDVFKTMTIAEINNLLSPVGTSNNNGNSNNNTNNINNSYNSRATSSAATKFIKGQWSNNSTAIRRRKKQIGRCRYSCCKKLAKALVTQCKSKYDR
jgi:hypothetical protein